MAEAESIETEAPPPRRAGRGIAWLALLIALAAAALAGYLYWQLVWIDGEVEALEADQTARQDAELLAALAAVREREQQASAERERLSAELDTVREALAAVPRAQPLATSSIAAALPMEPPDRGAGPRQWRLAEAAYLLRIANHRLLMERDAAGAAELLLAADQTLAEIDDFALHDARAAIAEERAVLLAFKGVDTQGVFLQIEAVKGLLASLPLRLPEYAAPLPDKDEPAADASMVDHLLARLQGMVRLRNHGEAIRPLLPPQQAEYLEQHLHLALERAQLAVLRRDQAIYAASLTAAGEQLRKFVNLNGEGAATVAAELDALLEVNLDAAPPDISRSLALLRAAPVPE